MDHIKQKFANFYWEPLKSLFKFIGAFEKADLDLNEEIDSNCKLEIIPSHFRSLLKYKNVTFETFNEMELRPECMEILPLDKSIYFIEDRKKSDLK